MKAFAFKSSLPASKSILNRALIIQSHFSDLKILGNSICDDVTYMKRALQLVGQETPLDCGEGGTTLRFLTLRISRLSQVNFLKANSRLMARPQQELVEVLGQLGVTAKVHPEGLSIQSHGWKRPTRPIQVGSGDSSQYASALLLNAWNLDFDLPFVLTGNKVSESYFAMTLHMVQELGMKVLREADQFTIPAGQSLKKMSYQAEPDLSSAFVFAAAGALFGKSEILNFPEKSLQPDVAFVEAFRKMNIQSELKDQNFTTQRSQSIQPVELDISQSPDLFPVLAVLCSYAQGVSHLYGAPHLAHKESNRIQKVADLFDLIGIKYEVRPDGMIIHGGSYPVRSQSMSYDTSHDHRMVMAASIFKKAGHNLNIQFPEAVNKSLPEFFELFEEQA